MGTAHQRPRRLKMVRREWRPAGPRTPSPGGPRRPGRPQSHLASGSAPPGAAGVGPPPIRSISPECATESLLTSPCRPPSAMPFRRGIEQTRPLLFGGNTALLHGSSIKKLLNEHPDDHSRSQRGHGADRQHDQSAVEEPPLLDGVRLLIDVRLKFARRHFQFVLEVVDLFLQLSRRGDLALNLRNVRGHRRVGCAACSAGRSGIRLAAREGSR